MMNTPSSSLPNDLVQQLRELPRSERRAQLHALMPLLDALFRQGVSHGALASSLTRAGLPLKPESLRKALRRWRQRATAPNAGASPAFSPSTAQPAPDSPTQRASRPSSPHPPSASSPGAITGKADLVRLRKSQDPIDLNQLAEMGRRK